MSERTLFDLRNRRVVLSGGLGLLGRQYIKTLSHLGARVIVLDIASSVEAERLLRGWLPVAQRRLVTYECCDITDEKALKAFARKVGRVHVLVNNAARTHKVEDLPRVSDRDWSFEGMSTDDWNDELRMNMTGTLLCCKHIGSRMLRGSSIINVSSIYGVVAPDQRIYSSGAYLQPIAYGATKAAVIQMTRYLATYWGKKGIRVNCIVPGGVENGQKKEFIRAYSNRTPLGRMARPGELSGIIVYLASDASSYATGATFTIDGGWSAW